MPNWATTTITFEGKPHEICDVHGFLCGRNGAIDFNNFIPEPKDIMERPDIKDANGFLVPAWYNWRCENWGTKWNAGSHWKNDNTLIVRTAWAPPAPILGKIEESFPDMTIDMEMYIEYDDCSYACHYENGKETFTQQFYDSDDINVTENYIINRNPIKKIDITEINEPLVYKIDETTPDNYVYVFDLSEKMDDALTKDIYEHYYWDQYVSCSYLGTFLIKGKYKQCVAVKISEDALKFQDEHRWLCSSGAKVRKGALPRWNSLEGLMSGSFVVYNGLVMQTYDERIGKTLSKEEIEKINDPFVKGEKELRKSQKQQNTQATPEEIRLWNYYNGDLSYETGGTPTGKKE